MPEREGDSTVTYESPTSPSWNSVGPVGRTGPTRWRDVRCAQCQQALAPVFDDLVDEDGNWAALQAADALHITLSGAYGEMLDTYDGTKGAYLCAGCAKTLLETTPWLLDLIKDSLNINVAHECGGRISWTPMSECRTTEDWHGWRPIWRVCLQGDLQQQVACYWDEDAAREHAAGIGGAQALQTLAGNSLPGWLEPEP